VGGQRTLVLLLGPPFSNYSFVVQHPVNRDDRLLLAFARASDFTVSKKTIFCIGSNSTPTNVALISPEFIPFSSKFLKINYFKQGHQEQFYNYWANIYPCSGASNPTRGKNFNS
jgi:hypothetical protein